MRGHGEEVGVAQHLIENHAVFQRTPKAGAAAGAAAREGILINGQEDVLIEHRREALLVALPLQRFIQDYIAGRARRLQQRLVGFDVRVVVAGIGS